MLVIMLHAELRGKAAPEDQYSEDALTSTVFGTLFTAGDAGQAILQAWLSRARRADPATPAWALPGGHLAYWFWPRLREAEPDVVLEVGAGLVVVEAKFHSGKSGGAASPPTADDPTFASTSAATRSDQLLREWRSVLPDRVEASSSRGSAVTSIQDAIARCEQRALVYLVKRSQAVKAERELAASLAAAGATSPRPAFYLLHWEHLDEVLSTAAATSVPRWQQELRAYLRHRGIAAFRGFGVSVAPGDEDSMGRLSTWQATWRMGQARWREAFTRQDMPLLAALTHRATRFSSRSGR